MSELLALYLMISLASGRNLDSKLLRICTPGNRLVQELASVLFGAVLQDMNCALQSVPVHAIVI